MFSFFSILFIIMGFGITIPTSAWLIASILAVIGLANIGATINRKDRLPDGLFQGLFFFILFINILFPEFSLPWVIWGVVIALTIGDMIGLGINDQME